LGVSRIALRAPESERSFAGGQSCEITHEIAQEIAQQVFDAAGSCGGPAAVRKQRMKWR